jgi:hypothetical protein
MQALAPEPLIPNHHHLIIICCISAALDLGGSSFHCYSRYMTVDTSETAVFCCHCHTWSVTVNTFKKASFPDVISTSF